MRSVFVTGAAGFIGSNLVRRLSLLSTEIVRIVAIDALAEAHTSAISERQRRWASFPPRGPSGPEIFAEKGDVGDHSFLSRLITTYGSPSVIFHLAAIPGVRYSEEHRSEATQANITALFTLLDFVSTSVPSAHFIFVSSSAVYGNQPRPWTEETLRCPSSLYARTKLQGESMVRSSGVPFTIIRPFTVYGPDGRPDMCVDLFMQRLYAGELAEVLGDGSAVRDLTFVEDVVDALCLVMQKPQVSIGKIYNIGSERPVTVANILELLAGALGIRPDYCRLHRLCTFQSRALFEAEATHCCAAKAHSELGWKASTSVEQGLKRTVDHFLKARPKSLVVAVVATYAARRDLLFGRAFPSILAQTRLPDAIVLIDDSPNAHEEEAMNLRAAADEALKSLCAGQQHPQLIVSKNLRTRLSASGAWNTGFHLAFSLWPQVNPHDIFVAVLDDDDEWLPQHLHDCCAILSRSAADWIVSGFTRIEQQRTLDIIATVDKLSLPETYFVTNPGVQGSNLFVRLTTFARAGCFDENLPSCTDRDLCIRLADLPTLRIQVTGRITVRHYANDPTLPRLSSRGSEVKLKGIGVFLRKHGPRMTSAQREQFIARAVDLFGWHPTPAEQLSSPPQPLSATVPSSTLAKAAPTCLLVGIISSSPATVSPLLEDLLFLTRNLPPPSDCGGISLCALRVLLLENGPRTEATATDFAKLSAELSQGGLSLRFITIEEQASDNHAGHFAVFSPVSPIIRAPIAVARTMVQTYVGAMATALEEREPSIRALALILDDDKRLRTLQSSAASACIPIASALRTLAAHTTVDALFATVSEAPPLPAPFIYRTTLVDHVYALQRLKDAEIQRFDKELQREAPSEWYHDLSASFFKHLEAPMSSSDTSNTTESLIRTLLSGHSLTRSLPATVPAGSTFIPRISDSMLRGGATFCWNPQRLLAVVPNTSPQLRGQRARRSDMIWALLARQGCNARTVISPDVKLHHDRSLSAVKSVAEMCSVVRADIWGFAAYRALQECLSVANTSADAFITAFEHYLQQRRVAFAFSLLRVRGLIGVLAPHAFQESITARHALGEFSNFAGAISWNQVLDDLRLSTEDRCALHVWAKRVLRRECITLSEVRRHDLAFIGARLLRGSHVPLMPVVAFNEITTHPVVAVVGDANFRTEEDAKKEPVALRVGKLLAIAGISVVCGGEGGVMTAVCKGHREGSALYRSTPAPVVVALRRDSSLTCNYANVIIPTNLGDARNAIIALSAVVIAIGGGAGTMSEICIAHSAGRHVIVLTGVTGITAALANRPLDARGELKGQHVFSADTADEAVAIARALLTLPPAAMSRLFL